MISPLPCPYPLNIPEEMRLEVFRKMTVEEKFAIANELSTEYRRRWMRSLHEWFPRATPAEFRQIAIDVLLAQSEEEKRISEACHRRQQSLGN